MYAKRASWGRGGTERIHCARWGRGTIPRLVEWLEEAFYEVNNYNRKFM